MMSLDVMRIGCERSFEVEGSVLVVVRLREDAAEVGVGFGVGRLEADRFAVLALGGDEVALASCDDTKKVVGFGTLGVGFDGAVEASIACVVWPWRR